MNSPMRSARKTFRWPLMLALGTALAASAYAFATWKAARHETPDVLTLYKHLQAQLDPRFPGRGITDYPGHTADDVPKGYAMILKAELLSARASKTPSLAGAAATFLMDHADTRGDGFPGWGVPLAWDPYGDGSINPAHTKYSISTGIVIDALLDWIAADPAAPKARVLELVRGSIIPYLQDGALSPSGLLPYSLEAVDRPYDTFNSAAYLAGAIQRYSVFEADPQMKARMQAVVDKTVAAHLAHRQVADSGSWFWHYSISEKVPNDLAHAAYIMHGMRLYADHGGTLASRLDIKAIERHVGDFVAPASGRIVAWPNFRKDTNTPARSYDLGMGLYLVCQRGFDALRAPYLASLPAYRTAAGSYLKYPPKPGQPDLAVREYEGYILLGLAACLGGRGQ
jgi:hypothetical protein